MTTNKPEVVGFATHHDEPMLFPSKGEAATYCDDGEEPVALIRLSDYEALQVEHDAALSKLAAIESRSMAWLANALEQYTNGDVITVPASDGTEEEFFAWLKDQGSDGGNSKPVPDDKPARITEQDAREIAESVVGYVGRGNVDYWFRDFGGRTLLNKLNADREQVPAVAVPDCFVKLYEHARGMRFGTDWNNGTAARHNRKPLIDATWECENWLASAPSHSQQSEQESTNVWEAALIEAAQSVVRANRNNTGREPSCSLLAMRIDELREILDDANVYYPGDTDRCPSHEGEQVNQCDGCMAGMALKEGNLHTDFYGNVVMVCQSDRYMGEQRG